MTKRLKRVSPVQLGKVSGLFYALFSLILLPFFILMMIIQSLALALVPHSQQAGTAGMAMAGVSMVVGVIFCIFVPILYGILGFIFGALGGLLYNLIAKWVGGIEFEVE